MKPVITTRQDQTFNIGQSASGRAAAAVERFAFVFPLLVLGGAIFYLPDYFGRYREQEPAPGFLLAALLIGTFFISLVAAVLRLLRNDLWSVDAAEGMLVYQANRLVRKGFDHSGIELEQVRRFVARLDDSPKESELLVEVKGHGYERIVDARFGKDSLRQAAEDLRAFLADEGLEIPVEVEHK